MNIKILPTVIISGIIIGMNNFVPILNSTQMAAFDAIEKTNSNLLIMGPAGTGKTTYLARNVLIPLMSQTRRCRILVLTPTNKAADVIS